MSDWTADERADWYQQQQLEERRMYEESQSRYRAAHPLADKCINHPDRQRDTRGSNEPYCAECRENHRRNYTDMMIDRDLSRRNDPATWGPECDMDGYHDRKPSDYMERK